MSAELCKPLIHGAFKIEREIPAVPSRVFAAWSDPALKARWFVARHGNWTQLARQLDFRVGGVERLHGRFESGYESLFTARYHAIVPDAQLVYVYDMHVNGAHLSLSLATVEFLAEGTGTRLVFNEQAVYFGGEDGTESRYTGTGVLLDQMAALF